MPNARNDNGARTPRPRASPPASRGSGTRSSSAFLKQVARTSPDDATDLQVHLVMDNYIAHKHPAVKAWLAANPRVHVHFTSTHG